MSGRPVERVAVYSTIHPGSAPYLGAWFDSLRRQTTRDFDLWIGLDGVAPGEIGLDWSRVGGAGLVEAEAGDTPAGLRRRAWERMAADYDAVVMVDSDDVLAPTRVAAAAASLAAADVSACACDLVDAGGRPLGRRLEPTAADTRFDALVRHNVFGLSNTVWRVGALESCLEGCEECVLLDWLLATRASLRGWRLGHDPRPHMLYRLHGANVTPVLAPFSARQIRRDTRLVLDHLGRLGRPADMLGGAEAETVARRRERVGAFDERVCGDEPRMERYLEKLNEARACLPWHACVAHPDLGSTWN